MELGDVAYTGEDLQKRNHQEDLHKRGGGGGAHTHNGLDFEYWNSLE